MLDNQNNNSNPPKNHNDISNEERELLNESFMSEEDIELKKNSLDETDEDGTPLNELSSASDEFGEDLDIPGVDEDDEEEKIGEEDEENNSYSFPD